MMRIITGTARGIKLATLEGDATRPTAERVKEAVFSMLQFELEGRAVLDLFAGSGQLGLEALSRGAEHAVIVDVSRTAIQAIERNAQAVLKDALPERAQIMRADYRSAIGSLGDASFDLVFLDPPYRMLDAYPDALKRLKSRGALNEDCVIVFERSRDAQVELPDGFECYDTRHYGATSIDFVRESAQ